MRLWQQYPLPPALVGHSTVSTIYEPVNDSPYVLVFYNFPHQVQQVERKHVYVFSYEAHAAHAGFGLSPAFTQ